MPTSLTRVRGLGLALCSIGLVTTPAAAQIIVVRETAPAGPTSEPPASQTAPAQAPRRLHRFGSFSIGVPMFDQPLEVVRPGANLNVIAGTDIGYVGFFGELGVSWNPIDLANASDPDLRRLGRDPLTRLYFGLGVRAQYPGERIRPYLDLTFYFNWWNFQETGTACGAWYCSTRNIYRFTPGWGLRPGLQINLKGSLALNLGVSFAFSYRGDFFPEAEYWLEPFGGIATRF